MSDSGEETTGKPTVLKRLGIAYCFRFGLGIVLVMLGAIASGYRGEMKSSGTPYFLGAFLTGIAMSILCVVNFHYWRHVIKGKATLSQKTQCLRIEIVICVISVIFGFAGIIIVGVNGVQPPACQSLFGSCSKEVYQRSNNFKLAVSILVLLILSIFINIAYIVIHWNTFKPDGIIPCKFGRVKRFINHRHQTPTRGNAASGLVLETRHGQPKPFQGAVLHPEGSSAAYHMANQNSVQDRPIVLNMRHGQPEPFQGVVLSGPTTNENVMVHNAAVHEQPLVQRNYNHQIPVGGRGSTGFVLNNRHGQPQPFSGAILSTEAQQPLMQGNASLVYELQEQNRLLREQLALQREQQGHHRAPINVPLPEAPPSYESCLADPSKIKNLEEHNRQLQTLCQQPEKHLSENQPETRGNRGSHLNPSAPPMK